VARAGLRAAAVAVAAVVLYVGVTFVQVWMASRRDDRTPSDAIVVFGAAQYDGRPSRVLRARLDHALALYRADVAPLIVVTGGKRPGDRYTEARVSADYLLRRGVPDERVLREVQGRTSWQSLASVANELRKRGLDEVVLVSDPFHAARIGAMAADLGLEAHVSPTRTSPIDGREEWQRMAREAVAVAVGRVVGFRV
jgi:uncharacterized SAM-binding protein YcdF (DUF218 family)